MMEYCDICGKEVETRIITRQESINVCGEEIVVDAQILVCAACGEELFCEELDSVTLINAYNEYRRKHKLLLPEEIKKIPLDKMFADLNINIGAARLNGVNSVIRFLQNL